MHLIIALLFLSIKLFASVSIDVDFQKEETRFKKVLSTEYNEVNTFKAIHSDKEIEIKLSKVAENPEAVAIELKLFDLVDGERKLLSAPKVIAQWDTEAKLESFNADKELMMLLKVTPLKKMVKPSQLPLIPGN